LKQKAIEVEGKTPSTSQLLRITDEAKASNTKVIFVQPQFDRKSADAIAKAVGCKIVVLDPLAKDLLNNLKKMANDVAKASLQ